MSQPLQGQQSAWLGHNPDSFVGTSVTWFCDRIEFIVSIVFPNSTDTFSLTKIPSPWLLILLILM